MIWIATRFVKLFKLRSRLPLLSGDPSKNLELHSERWLHYWKLLLGESPFLSETPSQLLGIHVRNSSFQTLLNDIS